MRKLTSVIEPWALATDRRLRPAELPLPRAARFDASTVQPSTAVLARAARLLRADGMRHAGSAMSVNECWPPLCRAATLMLAASEAADGVALDGPILAAVELIAEICRGGGGGVEMSAMAPLLNGVLGTSAKADGTGRRMLIGMVVSAVIDGADLGSTETGSVLAELDCGAVVARLDEALMELGHSSEVEVRLYMF